MFHLSKRLFHESALKSTHLEVSKLHLNIISTDYLDESINNINTHKKTLSRTNSVSNNNDTATQQ